MVLIVKDDMEKFRSQLAQATISFIIEMAQTAITRKETREQAVRITGGSLEFIIPLPAKITPEFQKRLNHAADLCREAGWLASWRQVNQELAGKCSVLRLQDPGIE